MPKKKAKSIVFPQGFFIVRKRKERPADRLLPASSSCVQAERAQASRASMRMPCSRRSRTMEAGKGFVAESTMTGLTQERLSGT